MPHLTVDAPIIYPLEITIVCRHVLYACACLCFF